MFRNKIVALGLTLGLGLVSAATLTAAPANAATVRSHYAAYTALGFVPDSIEATDRAPVVIQNLDTAATTVTFSTPSGNRTLDLGEVITIDMSSVLVTGSISVTATPTPNNLHPSVPLFPSTLTITRVQ
jgi:hypothetical protein